MKYAHVLVLVEFTPIVLSYTIAPMKQPEEYRSMHHVDTQHYWLPQQNEHKQNHVHIV